MTPSAYDHGYDTKAHSALKHWLAGDFPFPKPYSSNRQTPGRPRQPPRPHGGENAVGVGS